MALVDSDAPGRRSFALWAGPGTSALRPALRAGACPALWRLPPEYRGGARGPGSQPVGDGYGPSVELSLLEAHRPRLTGS